MRCAIKKLGWVDPVTCVACSKTKCKHYEEYYLKNRDKILEMVTKYTQEYPERYTMEVYMAQTKGQKTKHYLVVNKDQKIVTTIEEEKVKNMTNEDVGKYADKKILGPVTHEFAMVVKLQKKEWDGRLNVTTPKVPDARKK